MLTAFLDWFEEHKAGIIGTLALHTLLLFASTLFFLRSQPREHEISEMRIDVISDVEAEEIEQRIMEQEAGIPERVQSLTSNLTAEVKPNFSQAKLAERVENELRSLEQQEFDRLAEERRARGEERSGRVRKAELDKASTNTADECMLELALKSARETPFNASTSAADLQRGLITFRFVKQ